MNIKAKDMLEFREFSTLPDETRALLNMKYNSYLYYSVYKQIEEEHRQEKLFLEYQQKQLEAFKRAKKSKRGQSYY